VAAGENTADLAVTGSSLNGATVKDAVGNDAYLAGAAVNPAGILQVDTIAPHLTDFAASPASGSQTAGSAITFTLDFDEAVQVSGGTPTLSLNDGGAATYDAAASALLGDQSKLVFDYVVSASDTPTASLAITGLNTQGAAVTDLAGNLADLSVVSHVFDALAINQNSPPAGGNANVLPAFTINGFTRPELHLDTTGHIELDGAAAAFAAQYGLEYLYLGFRRERPFRPSICTEANGSDHLCRPLHRGLLGFGPRRTEIMRGVDQRDVRQRLREIAGLPAGAGVEFLRQQAEIVGDRHDTVEHDLRLVDITGQHISVGEPQAAGQERALDRLGLVRHLARVVAQHEPVAHHVPLDRIDRAADARIGRPQEADRGQQQQAGIEQF
jgi:hypothetical protein